MTGAEKWQRMHDPQCAADYGLSVTEAEMRTFPVGRAILAQIKRGVRDARRECRMMARIGEAFAIRAERMAVDVLSNDGGEGRL